MSALNTHTDTPSHAYHAYAHTCAPTLTYIYKQIHVYTHTGTCAHTHVTTVMAKDVGLRRVQHLGFNVPCLPSGNI